MAGAYVIYFLLYRTAYLTDARFLGALIFLEFLLACIWEYRRRFFPILILTFLWAGSAVPLQEEWAAGRWVFLAIGAVAGCFLYLEQRDHRFRVVHLLSMFCVLAATVSAFVSSAPITALLKSGSLLLLFLYAATGARVGIQGREEKFFKGLLAGCELAIYFTAVAYAILRWPFFGNPNSLGLVMGVVMVPMMFWGVLVSRTSSEHWRRGIALVIAVLLLLSSYERAGLAAASAACVLLCVGSRKYRLLLKVAAFALVAALMVAAVVPMQEIAPGDLDQSSLVSRFLYKGRPEAGILGSRKSVWQQTVSTLKQHPWFGTGFGTTNSPYENTSISMTSSAVHVSKEDGSSYLAIVEWTGLIGAVPFLALVGLVLLNIGRVFRIVRRSNDVQYYAVPIVGVLVAGLVNAAFEDWLFAVGYYACVFFWALAFVLPDLIPAASPAACRTVARGGASDPRLASRVISGNHIPVVAGD